MVQKTNINTIKQSKTERIRKNEKNSKAEFRKEDMQGERDKDARMSKHLGSQMLPTVMYFTDFSRIILLSAMVENKIQ